MPSVPTVLIVNCSAALNCHYNLGAAKLAHWHRLEGWQVDEWNHKQPPGLLAYAYDRVCLSVIFSWDAPKALFIARGLRDWCEVWAGGPGLAQRQVWWEKHAGFEPVIRPDERFDKVRGGNFKMTFASRGCPVGCWFCVVPRIEGSEFSLDWDFEPAPILCDNNLSALPIDFQEHIVRRYLETGTRLRDANSGFEPATFDEDTYHRWKPVIKGAWRYAYDETKEGPDVERVSKILSGVAPRRKRVYVLIGNEPVEACYARVRQVIDWKCEPFCQYVLPLNWLGDPKSLKHRFDWTWQRGRDFSRWVNRMIYKSAPLQEYNNRQGEKPPFAHLLKVTS